MFEPNTNQELMYEEYRETGGKMNIEELVDKILWEYTPDPQAHQENLNDKLPSLNKGEAVAATKQLLADVLDYVIPEPAYRKHDLAKDVVPEIERQMQARIKELGL